MVKDYGSKINEYISKINEKKFICIENNQEETPLKRTIGDLIREKIDGCVGGDVADSNLTETFASMGIKSNKSESEKKPEPALSKMTEEEFAAKWIGARIDSGKHEGRRVAGILLGPNGIKILRTGKEPISFWLLIEDSKSKAGSYSEEEYASDAWLKLPRSLDFETARLYESYSFIGNVTPNVPKLKEEKVPTMLKEDITDTADVSVVADFILRHISHRAIPFGGYVRDLIAGETPKDID